MSMELSSDLLAPLESTLGDDPQLLEEARQNGVNEAGRLLNVRAAQPGEDRFAERDYWHAFLQELHDFLCSDSKKYAAQRQQIKDVDKATSAVIVPAIAAGVAVSLNIEAAILVPFVNLALFAIVKLSVNSWCAASSEKLGNALEDVKPSQKRSVTPSSRKGSVKTKK
jgi:hypothetical protein